MPEVKSRLLQSILKEQKRRAVKDRAVYEELGVPQQTFSTWKAGVIPRPRQFPAIAAFLGVSEEDVAEMAREAAETSFHHADYGRPHLRQDFRPQGWQIQIRTNQRRPQTYS